MTVLVCGGRTYADWPRLDQVLTDLHRTAPITRVLSGAASGADALAERWARQHQVVVSRFLPDWRRLGRAAGPRRNRRMLDEGKPDLVVAFPGGKGTADLVRQAHAAGIRVVIAGTPRTDV